MENEKFQELMLDQFAKMFKELQDVKTDISGLKTDVLGLQTYIISSLKTDITELKDDVSSLKVRMENKYDKQISTLHDFRVDQEKVNQEIKDIHTTIVRSW